MSSSTNPVGSSSNSNSSTSSQSSIQQALNITPADFLRLITTQMQDQNPLQPSDPTQFLTQLEQMSQVSSMQSMQSSLSSLQTAGPTWTAWTSTTTDGSLRTMASSTTISLAKVHSVASTFERSPVDSGTAVGE